MHDMLYAGWQGQLDSLAQQHQERLLHARLLMSHDLRPSHRAQNKVSERCCEKQHPEKKLYLSCRLVQHFQLFCQTI